MLSCAQQIELAEVVSVHVATEAPMGVQLIYMSEVWSSRRRRLLRAAVARETIVPRVQRERLGVGEDSFPLLFDLAGIGCSSLWERSAPSSARPATVHAGANQVLYEI